jgi:general secretion pathway protein D
MYLIMHNQSAGRLVGSLVLAAVLLGLWAAPSVGQSRSDTLSDWQMGTIANASYQNKPITSVFQMISDLTGWSILMSPEVSRQPPHVSMWIKSMSPKDALEQVCRVAGLTWDRDGTTVLVMNFEEYSQRFGLAKQVIPLKHASADEVVKILQPFADKDDRARILSDPRANAVVLLIPKTLLSSIEQLIAQLDVELTGRADTIKIVALEHLEAAEILPRLTEFFAQSAGPTSTAKGTTAPPAAKNDPNSGVLAGDAYLVRFLLVPRLNVLILRGLRGDIAKVEKLIRKLDVPHGRFARSYPLKHTDAEQLFNTLQQIVRTDPSRPASGTNTGAAARLHVAASVQNNRIVVEGTAADHERIVAVIQAIDQPLPAGSGGTRIYRLENASALQVVAVLEDLIDSAEAGSPQAASRQLDRLGDPVRGIRRVKPPASDGGAAAGGNEMADEDSPDDQPARVVAAPEINAVVIQASAAKHDQFVNIIAQLDCPRDQVVLEVTLVAVQSSEGFDIGLELARTSLSGAGVNTIGFTHFGIGSVDTTTGAIRFSDKPLLGANFTIFKSNEFSVVLNALKSVGDVRITSAPRIVTEDNVQATISHVTQEPFETTDQGETTTTTAFGGFVDAGTILSVLPHISRDNWLRLTYHASFSSFNARIAPNLPPPRTENTIQGTVRIPADYTVILGGLAGTRQEDVTTAVPFLSEIPLLGELFSNRSQSETYETVYVFVRPVLLRDRNFDDLLRLSRIDLRNVRLNQQDGLTNPLKMLPLQPPSTNGKEQ